MNKNLEGLNKFAREHKCTHRRTGKHFSYGRNSGCSIYCKDCGAPISKLEISKKKQQERKERKY
jgi:hypothetical protein